MSARSPEEVHALLEAAFNSGDLDAFVAVFEPEATMASPPDGRRAHGTGEIRAALAPAFALHPRAEIEVVDTLESDGLALTHAHWALTGTDPGDGSSVEMSGRGTIVSRRQGDGSWRIVIDNPLSFGGTPAS